MTHPLGNVPIIGQPSTYPRGADQSANAPGLTSRIEIYDSEIIEIERVSEILNSRSNGSIDRDSFHDEIKDRFAEIGFIVRINWYEFGVDGKKVEGALMPEIVITDRTDRKAFDHDQQVHEVTNDLLGLGDGGVIKTDPADFQKPTPHQH